MKNVATVRFHETIQILFPGYRRLRVAIVCARFGETYIRRNSYHYLL
jgi:hypothetical protein